jgi:hypothetical protein
MKMYIFLVLLFANLNLVAQSMVEGNYLFRKQEMVAGFQFTADGKFAFFYSYGAVDRSARGSFSVAGDTLKLRSDKEAGKDFTVTAQSKKPGGYKITFSDPNKALLAHIRCIFFVEGKPKEEYSDDNGIVELNLPSCDTIYVQHGLYPDIVTLVKDKGNTNNNFVLTLNPTLEGVSFKGIDFKIEKDGTLTCNPNYFMEMENIRFVKEVNQ